MGRFYATLISDKLVKTINFYEDHFGFSPIVEKDGYVLLQKKDDPDFCIALFDSKHPCIRNAPPVRGVILNLAVSNVQSYYDDLYMEGLEIFKEYGTDIHGRNHFVVYDPNGVMINIHEAVEVRELVAA